MRHEGQVRSVGGREGGGAAGCVWVWVRGEMTMVVVVWSSAGGDGRTWIGRGAD
jgi:hypothetical protein